MSLMSICSNKVGRSFMFHVHRSSLFLPSKDRRMNHHQSVEIDHLLSCAVSRSLFSVSP